MGAISRKFHRSVLVEAKDIVAAAGGTCRLDTGNSGHGKLLITIEEKTRSTTISCTPRSFDEAIKMKLADVRRILREMKH